MTAEQTVEMTVLGTDKGTLRFLCARPLDWARTHRNSLGLEGFLGKRACWFVLKQTTILSRPGSSRNSAFSWSPCLLLVVAGNGPHGWATAVGTRGASRAFASTACRGKTFGAV